MKKLFAIIVAVALMVALMPLSTVVFAAQNNDEVEMYKDFEYESYGLCDIVYGVIHVEITDAVVVEDIFPAGLTLDDANVDPADGETIDIDQETNTLTVWLPSAGTYDIYFRAEVTYARADEAIEVTNTATVYDDDGWDYEHRAYGESCSATITVEPYEDFSKVLGEGEDDWVMTRTYAEFMMYVDIYNSLDVDMLDVMVVDNLPGNVKYLDWDLDEGEGSVEVTLTGKTEKAHLVWDLEDDLDTDSGVETELYVATDTVGGKDADKHQMKKSGKYTLNPGATLMFTDGDTGYPCMVDSAAVRVDVVQAVPIS